MTRPRTLFIGHSRVALPLPPQDEKKWRLLGERMDLRIVMADGGGTDEGPFRRLRTGWGGPLSGALFYAALPVAVRRHEADFRPDVIICQSPYETAMVQLGRPKAPVICEVHGDWETAATAYGSRARSLLAAPAAAVARTAVRRAQATRPVGPTMAQLVRDTTGHEPTRTFATWFDSDAFWVPRVPLPARPTALSVGVLQPYKNPAVLAEAWPQVLRRVPNARLVVVGRGPQQPIVDALVAAHPDSVEHHAWLDASAVRKRFDDAWLLALPSRSEGLPRVGLEAMLRGRAIVGARAGGIPDLIRDGQTGRLVPERDAAALAEALADVLSDAGRAAAMGAAAAEDAPRFALAPEAYADAVLDLVETVRRSRPA